MVITRIFIKSFGGITDREILLDAGCNTVYGPNEAGKSTLLAFIRFVFYGVKMKKDPGALSFKEKYLPWDGSPMEGEIEYTVDGCDYAAIRRVGARAGRAKEITVVNKTTGEEMSPDYCKELGANLFGMSDAAFTRTLFITANAIAPDKEGELLGRLSNLAETGEDDLSYTKVNGAVEEEILALSSPRRAGAVIPSLEQEEVQLSQELAASSQLSGALEEKRRQLAQAQADYTRAEQEKKRLDEQLKKARAAADARRYGDAERAAKEAQDALAEAKEALSRIRLDGYEKIAAATPEQERVLFSDDTAQENELRTRKILLGDKRDVCRRLKFVFAIIAGAALIAACSGWWLFWLIMIVFGVAFFYEIYRGEQLDGQIAEIEQELEQSGRARAEVLNALGVASAEEYRILQREYNEKKAQYDRCADRVQLREQAAAKQLAVLETVRAELAERYGDELPCQEEVPPMEEGAAERAARSMVESSARIAALKGEIFRMEETAEARIACAERLDEVRGLLAVARKRLAVLETAKKLLSVSYEELKGNFAPALAAKTSELFAAVTGGKYGELLVDDAFGVKIKSDGNYRDAKFLSAGAFEQLYFSLRLGIIEIIAQNKSFPLIIDDAFVTFDDARLAGAAAFLQQYGNQVILCTCHAREASALGGRVITLETH